MAVPLYSPDTNLSIIDVVGQASDYLTGLSDDKVKQLLQADNYLSSGGDEFQIDSRGYGASLHIINMNEVEQSSILSRPEYAGYLLMTVYLPEVREQGYCQRYAFPLTTGEVDLFNFLKDAKNNRFSFTYYDIPQENNLALTVSVYLDPMEQENFQGIETFCQARQGLCDDKRLRDDFYFDADSEDRGSLIFPTFAVPRTIATLRHATGDRAEPQNEHVQRSDSAVTYPRRYGEVRFVDGPKRPDDFNPFYPYDMPYWQYRIFTHAVRNIEPAVSQEHIDHAAIESENRDYFPNAQKVGNEEVYFSLGQNEEGQTLWLHLADASSFCCSQHLSLVDERHIISTDELNAGRVAQIVEDDKGSRLMPTISFRITQTPEGNIVFREGKKGWIRDDVHGLDTNFMVNECDQLLDRYVDFNQIPLSANTFEERVAVVLNHLMAEFFTQQQQDIPYLLIQKIINRDNHSFSAIRNPVDFLILQACEQLMYWNMNNYPYRRHDLNYMNGEFFRNIDFASIWPESPEIVYEWNHRILSARDNQLDEEDFARWTSFYMTRSEFIEQSRLDMLRILYDHPDEEFRKQVVSNIVKALDEKGLYFVEQRAAEQSRYFKKFIELFSDSKSQVRAIAALFGHTTFLIGDEEEDIVSLGDEISFLSEWETSDQELNNTLLTLSKSAAKLFEYHVERIGGDDHKPTFGALALAQTPTKDYTSGFVVVSEGNSKMAQKVAAEIVLQKIEMEEGVMRVRVDPQVAITYEERDRVQELARNTPITGIGQYGDSYVSGNDYLGQLINKTRGKASVIELGIETEQAAGLVSNVSGVAVILDGQVIAIHKCEATSAKEARRQAAFIIMRELQGQFETPAQRISQPAANARMSLNNLYTEGKITKPDVKFSLDTHGVHQATVTVEIDGEVLQVSSLGGKKKEAEENAAQQLLELIRNLDI